MFPKSLKNLWRSTIVKGGLVVFFSFCCVALYAGSWRTTTDQRAAAASLPITEFAATELSTDDSSTTGACDAVTVDQVYRFVEGIDNCLVPMNDSDLQTLNDPFATALLRNGVLPESPEALDQALHEAYGYQPTVYIIGEGAQVPLTVAPRTANRSLRDIIFWGEHENDAQVMLATLAPATGATEFELISYDTRASVYNYYARRTQVSDDSGGEASPVVWAWVGNTSMTQQPETRNNGCFRCHHNGLPIMRELEEPWANWHSQHGIIPSSVVPTEIANDPFFLPRRGAEVMEGVVRGNFERYYQNWLAQNSEQQADTTRLSEVDKMLRHLTTNTTVNFKSTRSQSASINTGPAGIDITSVPPRDTFLADTLLQKVLGLEYKALSVTLPRDAYDAYLSEHNFRIEGTEDFFSGPVAYEAPGSTYFAFYVPQIAAEDMYMAQLLLNAGIVTKKFVAALLMVDYQNPLFSEKRASLQHYVDAVTEGTVANGTSSVPADVVAAIEATGAVPCSAAGYDDCSAEEQFLYTWYLPEESWQATTAARLQSYVDTIKNLPAAERLDTLMRWSVSQRNRFLATPRLCNLYEVSAHFPATDLAEFPVCPQSDEEVAADDRTTKNSGKNEAGASFIFNAPGFVNDFLPSEGEEAALMQQRWHDYLYQFTERSLQNDPWGFSNQTGEAMSYFNPATSEIPDGAPTVIVPWTVYPNRIKFYYPDASREEHWAYADEGPPPSPDPDNYSVAGHRDWQDEYGEWSVSRNDAGKITRVQFTTETREYWYALWDVSPRAVLRLYRQLASEEVELEDLYLRNEAGEPIIDPQTGRPAYDGFNQWNGQADAPAVHMLATFNFYGGALFLSAQSTVLREDEQGMPILDPNQLLNCSLHGTPYRNSDPFISALVNDLVRGAGVQITLEDPVGVYMQTPNFNLYQLPPHAPAGAKPSDYWTVVRGRARQDGETHDYILHAVYEVPEEHGFTVGDITINGFPIEYGAQIAETINVATAGVGVPKADPAQALPCVGDGTLPYPALLREKPLLSVADRSKLTMRIEQGATIENVALKARHSDYETQIEFVDGPGVTATKTGFQEEDGSQLFTLSITADADATLGNRSLLLTNADGEGLSRYGMLEVIAPSKGQ